MMVRPCFGWASSLPLCSSRFFPGEDAVAEKGLRFVANEKITHFMKANRSNHELLKTARGD
jgi:hypothetical protein